MKPTTKPPLTTPKAVLYCRVSSEGQIEGTSLDTQVERGKSFVNSQGWALDKVFIENGESGKSTNRTAFQQMLSYLQENPVDILLTFKLDRLSRNLRDILNLIHEQLDPKKIALQSVTENFNSRSSEGMLLLQMLGSFAEFERKRINERTMAGKIATAKRGNWNGGHVPFGFYRKIEGSPYDFDVDPQDAPIVKKIFRLYAQGYGAQKIKTLTGCPLTRQCIIKLLKNPFYCGKVQFDGIIEDNNHPKIISERLFNKCQRVREIKQLAA